MLGDGIDVPARDKFLAGFYDLPRPLDELAETTATDLRFDLFEVKELSSEFWPFS